MYDFHLERKTVNENLRPLVENLTKKIPSGNSGFTMIVQHLLMTVPLLLGRLLLGIVPQIKSAFLNCLLIL